MRIGTSTTMSFWMLGMIWPPLPYAGFEVTMSDMGPCQRFKNSWASSTSSRVNGVTSSRASRFTTATLFSPQTPHARRTTSAVGSAVIPRTPHVARRAPQHGHSISRIVSRIAPIQSIEDGTAGRVLARLLFGERADERARDPRLLHEVEPGSLDRGLVMRLVLAPGPP